MTTRVLYPTLETVRLHCASQLMKLKAILCVYSLQGKFDVNLSLSLSLTLNN
jgi:hypothetical protein